MASGIHTAVAGHRREDSSIVHADSRLLEAERDQRRRGRQDQLDLGDLRRDAEDVDVALGELPETALLRSLGSPDRPDLDRLERIRQGRPIVGVVARERHREIEAETEVREVFLPLHRYRVELRAALEDLVDQLLVLAPAAAQQELQVLEGRRLHATESVTLVRRQDRRGGLIAKLYLGWKQILHSAGRRGVELHGHGQAFASAVW